MRRTSGLVLTAATLLSFLGASCSSDDNAGSANTIADATAARTVSGDVNVFAAASLTAAYTEIGDAFMADNPNAKVTFNFGSSSDLVTQINEGAPADVYASADQVNMTKLTDAGGNAGEPRVFAANLLQIIVEPGNPKGITGVADLARPDVLYVTCAPEVPIGKYALQVLTNAGVTVAPVSLEENVKGIVTKVTLGEADAGIVYKTDVTAAGDQAGGVDIPDNINVVATYPVVATKAATNAEGAQAFIDFVVGEKGQAILASYGLLAP
ncbi:MAG: molybdate ABC transporter substrate-binding protein [Ilumatobacteraceae bacterium]